MIRVLTDHDRISSAQACLRQLLEKGATRQKDVELGFRGGKLDATQYWLPDLELWVALEKLHNRYWNAFGLGDPDTASNRSIVVEVNSPFHGVNRRVAGAFGVDESNLAYLLHRGKVGGGREGIGKAAFLPYYQSWGALETVDDGDQETQAVVITALDNPRARAHIASFVRVVERFKRRVTTDALPPGGSSDDFTPEFSGQRQIPQRDEIVARCDHGTIVNALAAELEQREYRVENDQARDLFLRDGSGHVRILFEVKMGCDTTSLYGAVGQLVLHASVQRPPIRVAVLPSETPDVLVARLSQRGIKTLLFQWHDEKVLFPSLTRLLSQA